MKNCKRAREGRTILARIRFPGRVCLALMIWWLVQLLPIGGVWSGEGGPPDFDRAVGQATWVGKPWKYSVENSVVLPVFNSVDERSGFLWGDPVAWIAMAAGVGTVVLVVVGMLLWNRSLRRNVEQKTRELQEQLGERNKAEEALQKARDELEAKVSERTADLVYANQQLQLEVIQHKVTAAKLSESEERFRLFAEFAPFCIALRNRYGAFEYLNPRFVAEFGFTLKDIPTEEAWLEQAFDDPEEREIRRKQWQARSFDTPEAGAAGESTFRIRCKDGSRKAVSLRAVALANGGGILCLENVTDRLESEEERARLATVMEQASELVILTDLQGRVQYVNRAFEMTTGFGRAEVIGRALPVLAKGEGGQPEQRGLLNILQAGEVWRGHLPCKTKQGTHYDVQAIFFPIRGPSGEMVGFASLQRDVTHEMLLEKQLRQSQKLEAIGTLAGGIAHDFNNILAAIMGYTEMSLDMIPGGSLAQHNLEQVLKAANRAKDLVKQILLFSRRGEQERQPLIFAPTVKEALKLLRASLPATIDMRTDIRVRPESQILADATQIHQVVINLCTNAAHAMRDKGGVLEVELAEEVLDASQLTSEHQLRPGPYLRLTVKDSGHGMEREILERIFEPFFTTKNSFEGTGMGLAVVHGIVTRHDGFIRVASEPGAGTVFDVYFPKHTGPISIGDADPKTIPRGQGRILFVDDEEALTRLAREVLESLGYEVSVEEDCARALEKFAVQPDHFDLVITDYTMPGMTGLDLAQEIRRIRPETPIILCSGYSEGLSRERMEETGIKAFMMKPLRVHEIAETVSRVLSGG